MLKKRTPTWWLIYLIVAIFLGLLWFELKDSLNDMDHRIAEVAIMAAMFGSIFKWLKYNEIAIMNEEQSKHPAPMHRQEAERKERSTGDEGTS